MSLPIDVESILRRTTVESDRVEYKEGWNPNAIYRSICAFANDFDNIGGGYIIVGVAEVNGVPIRPAKGLSIDELDRIQRQMIGFNALIQPEYYPRLSIENIDNVKIVVLWVPGSSNRPHRVPENITDSRKSFFYYIRRYSSSVKASALEQQELLTLANQIPFDDRSNTEAVLDDISFSRIREYLEQTKSRLGEEVDKLSKEDLMDRMALLSGPPELRLVRNVSLMVFCEKPEKFFPYTQVELIQFDEGPGDKVFSEKIFRGPVQQQIRLLTEYLSSQIIVEKIEKIDSKSESIRVFNYPLIALQEAIANCIFHRDYQVREPIKIFIYSDKITLYNSGGPDRSVRLSDLRAGKSRPKRYRNRRLGDFLKALKLTEGHATGIPLIMKSLEDNGSPAPEFDIDEDRTYFEITFNIHPEFSKTRNVQTLKHDKLLEVLMKHITVAKETINVPLGVEYITLNFDPISLHILRMLRISGTLSRKDIFNSVKLSNQTYNFNKYLEPLISKGYVNRMIKDKPSSPLQKYYLTKDGNILAEWLLDNNYLTKL